MLLVSEAPATLPSMKLAELFDSVSSPVPLSVTAVLPVAPILRKVAAPLEFWVIAPSLVTVPSSVVVEKLSSVSVLPAVTDTPLSVAVPLLVFWITPPPTVVSVPPTIVAPARSTVEPAPDDEIKPPLLL